MSDLKPIEFQVNDNFKKGRIYMTNSFKYTKETLRGIEFLKLATAICKRIY